jgi:hypothetical protein
MKSGLAILALLLLGTAVHADEVYLKGGGHISGIVVEESDGAIHVEIGAGLVSVPLTQVARVVRSASPLATYQMRAHNLRGNDVSGWLELGAWAQSMDLSTQAREAYNHVLQLDPTNAAAHRALGNQLVGDRWLSHDDAMRAQGYLPFEGQWVTPEEREALLADRAEARHEGLELAKSRAALAEAEARAREAEAHARVVEAEADRAISQPDPGVPASVGPYGYTPYGYAGYAYVGPYPGTQRPHGHPHDSNCLGAGDCGGTEVNNPPHHRHESHTEPPPSGSSHAGRPTGPSTGSSGLSVAGYEAEHRGQ